MNREKIIDRVRKLLAMANDTSSPNEAAIAAGRARKLIDQYQISEMDLTTVEDSDFGQASYGMGAKSTNKPLGMLAVAVAELNDCNAIWTTQDNGTKAVQFSGMLVDAVSATEMLKYLQQVMYKLAVKAAEGRSDRHAYRLGFAVGVQQQVREILKERAEIKTDTGQALVVVKQQLVEQHFGARKWKQRRNNYSGDAGAYHRGEAAGRKVSLNRQVRGTQQGRLT